MEAQIKSYEKFIKEAAKTPTKELAKYHDAMLKNFQHERLIHLIIMLFFVVLTLGALALSAVCSYYSLVITASFPIYVLTIILIVLTCAYVKHYYFLENHIQALYPYSKEIYDKLK